MRNGTSYYRTPPPIVRRTGTLLIVSVLLAFVLLRTTLHLSPDSDLDVAGFNIHHLFTGLILIVAGGVPLAVFRGYTRRIEGAIIVFGAGLGMALDEWVYLIATDGSNASYLLPVSFWGGLIAIALALGYTATLVLIRLRRGAPAPAPADDVRGRSRP